MEIKHLLFDLDGTLLPMVQEEFVKFYMPLLAKAYLEAGVRIDPKKFIGAVWKGYEAMMGVRRTGKLSGPILIPAFRYREKSPRHLQMHFMTGSLTGQSVQRSRQSCQMQS